MGTALRGRCQDEPRAEGEQEFEAWTDGLSCAVLIVGGITVRQLADSEDSCLDDPHYMLVLLSLTAVAQFKKTNPQKPRRP